MLVIREVESAAKTKKSILIAFGESRSPLAKALPLVRIVCAASSRKFRKPSPSGKFYAKLGA